MTQFVLTITIFLFISVSVANPGITYHGRILYSNDLPVESNNVVFKSQIFSPGSEKCLMYEEVKTISMVGSNGLFSLTLNDGTGTRTDLSGLELSQIFSNRTSFSFSAGQCEIGTSYNPTSNDTRKFTLSFREGSSSWQTLPIQNIQYAPTALEALNVGGFPAQALCRVENSGSPSSISALTNQQWTELLSLVNGNSSLYLTKGTSSTTCSATQKGTLKYSDGTDIWEYCNGSTWRPFESAGCKGPASCQNPNQTCNDGTIFIGCFAPNYKPTFITRCDGGRTWDGISCVGTRGLYTWNSGSASGKTTTNATNPFDGLANTSLIVATDAKSDLAGFQFHQAAKFCDDLTIHGYSDWYLPSYAEMMYLQYYYNSIEDLITTTSYFSSHEDSAGAIRGFQMGGNPMSSFQNKESSRHVRCARREQ